MASLYSKNKIQSTLLGLQTVSHQIPDYFLDLISNHSPLCSLQNHHMGFCFVCKTHQTHSLLRYLEIDSYFRFSYGCLLLVI